MKLDNAWHGHQLLAAGGPTVEQADVVVIGSGCGGGTLAALLAEAGKSVVLLEQGGLYTAEDMDQREANMLARIDGGRGLDSSPNMSVQLTYGNNVGGASVHYWADSFRTPPERLQLWAERYQIQGHGPEDLAPFFDVIERDLNVHPAADAYVNRMNALVRDAGAALGWRVARVPQARRGCVASGYCHQGCAYDAKQSQIVTYLPRALRAGARLYADCRAALLKWEGARVRSVTAQVLDRATGRATGQTLTVEARAVVVAAGGYGTPTFLLTQNLREHLPHLGEHLFCNPCPMVTALFDEEIVLWRNIPAAWCVEEWRDARHDASSPGQPTAFFGQQGRYLEGGYLLMPNQLQPALLAAVLPGVGPEHRALLRALPRVGGTIAWIDDAEEGRVTWDGARRRVNVPLTGGNELRIRDAWRKQARLLLRAGAKQVLFGDLADTRITREEQIEPAVAAIDLRPARNVLAAPHPGGAARMGTDPMSSVVGFDHRVHGTDNLFVADGSVFPTGPAVDPSLTIMAFSYVAARSVAAAL